MGFHRIVGAQHAPHHLTDQRDRDRCGLGGNFLRKRARRRQQLIRRHNLADEAAAERFLCRENPTRVAPLQRLRDADDARQEPARRCLRHDAALGEHEAEARGVAGDADIHRKLHGDADADGRAVDRGDHRLQAFEDAQRNLTAAVADLRVAIVHMTVGKTLDRAAPRVAVESVGAC